MRKIHILFENKGSSLKLKSKHKGGKLIESLDQTNLKSTESIVLEGVCIDFDAWSENDRFYSKPEYLEEFFRLALLAEERKLFGSADHPEREDFIVKSSEIAFIIEKLWYVEDENKCYIRLRLIPTINGGGYDLIQVVNHGGVLSTSSRAVGYLDEETKEAYIDTMYTFDVVTTPGFKIAELRVIDEQGLVESANVVNKQKFLEKAKSIAQQKLFGQALAIRRGEQQKKGSDKSVIDIVDGDMTDKQIEDFATTKHEDLPQKIQESVAGMTDSQRKLLSGTFSDYTKIIEEAINKSKLDEMNIEDYKIGQLVELNDGSKVTLKESPYKNGGAFKAMAMTENDSEIEIMMNENSKEWEKLAEEDPLMEMFESIQKKALKRKNIVALKEVRASKSAYKKKLVENKEEAEEEAMDAIEKVDGMLTEAVDMSKFKIGSKFKTKDGQEWIVSETGMRNPEDTLKPDELYIKKYGSASSLDGLGTDVGTDWLRDNEAKLTESASNYSQEEMDIAEKVYDKMDYKLAKKGDKEAIKKVLAEIGEDESKVDLIAKMFTTSGMLESMNESNGDIMKQVRELNDEITKAEEAGDTEKAQQLQQDIKNLKASLEEKLTEDVDTSKYKSGDVSVKITYDTGSGINDELTTFGIVPEADAIEFIKDVKELKNNPDGISAVENIVLKNETVSSKIDQNSVVTVNIKYGAKGALVENVSKAYPSLSSEVAKWADEELKTGDKTGIVDRISGKISDELGYTKGDEVIDEKKYQEVISAIMKMNDMNESKDMKKPYSKLIESKKLLEFDYDIKPDNNTVPDDSMEIIYDIVDIKDLFQPNIKAIQKAIQSKGMQFTPEEFLAKLYFLDDEFDPKFDRRDEIVKKYGFDEKLIESKDWDFGINFGDEIGTQTIKNFGSEQEANDFKKQFEKDPSKFVDSSWQGKAGDIVDTFIDNMSESKKLVESADQKSALEMAEELDFKTEDELYTYIEESIINGQRKQAKELYMELNVAGKKGFARAVDYLELTKSAELFKDYLNESNLNESKKTRIKSIKKLKESFSKGSIKKVKRLFESESDKLEMVYDEEELTEAEEEKVAKAIENGEAEVIAETEDGKSMVKGDDEDVYFVETEEVEELVESKKKITRAIKLSESVYKASKNRFKKLIESEDYDAMEEAGEEVEEVEELENAINNEEVEVVVESEDEFGDTVMMVEMEDGEAYMVEMEDEQPLTEDDYQDGSDVMVGDMVGKISGTDDEPFSKMVGDVEHYRVEADNGSTQYHPADKISLKEEADFEELYQEQLVENKSIKTELDRVSKFCETASKHIFRLEEFADDSSKHILKLQESGDAGLRAKTLNILKESKESKLASIVVGDIVKRYPKMSKLVESGYEKSVIKFDQLTESNKNDVYNSMGMFTVEEVSELINEH